MKSTITALFMMFFFLVAGQVSASTLDFSKGVQVASSHGGKCAPDDAECLAKEKKKKKKKKKGEEEPECD
ncbi:MAG: hypothetical protein ISR69_01920 [Gammaproteobacteria bacterium]|nr:hypothetical protein [Gammaproteobacteria bacterium]